MTEFLSLAEAVSKYIDDGVSLAIEGFTHLIPFAAAHEIVRQKRTGLTLIRLTPDIVADQLIGMGCVAKLVFSWGGNPGVGSLHRFRDAVEHGWPHSIELQEHSHGGLAARFVAGASGLPFATMRGYAGTSLASISPVVHDIVCPFTGEVLSAIAAIRPDVTVIHAQQADRSGNVQLWGIPGIQKEAVLAARVALVTVEEIVDRLDLKPGAVVLPSWVLASISHVPGGAHPSYASGYSTRDNEFYRSWDAISRDRSDFQAWMSEQIMVNRS